jgi:hypothetical protein
LTTKFHHGSRNRILIDYTIFSNPQNLWHKCENLSYDIK